jgi:hypothetical protein
MTTANQWKSWIKRLGYPEKPRAERRVPSGFAARQANNLASRPAIIQNISSSGLYLITEDRWPIGKVLSLKVHVDGLPENQFEPEFPVQARVIRHGEDGVGLTFVLPEGLDANLWEVMIRNTVVLTDPKDILFTIKMIGTILFLCRLCHEGAHDAILLLGGELDQTRTETALEIALSTEKLLATEPGADKMRAHPQLMMNVLKYASWAHDEVTRQLWTGLMATSCSAEGTDESNSSFVDLLVNITTTQSHIFIAACSRAKQLMTGADELPPKRINLSPEEMIQLTGMHDIPRIATDMAYLFNLGLIERNFDFTSYIPMDNFDITPARLGLEMYKRCKGERVNLQAVLDDMKHAATLPQK